MPCCLVGDVESRISLDPMDSLLASNFGYKGLLAAEVLGFITDV